MVVVVQVASKNKAGYEVEKASELLGVEQVDLVVLVARNKGMSKAIKRFMISP